MYARIENGSVQQFPYSLRRLEMDNPNTSFPKPIKEGTLASFGVYKVADVAAPEVTDTQVAYHTGNIVEVDGQWQREWAIRDKTPEELQAEIQAEREAMWSTRAKFALSAYNAGIITATEAEAWAGGTSLPQVVIDAFDTNIQDAGERLAARIDALTATNIHRVNPLILLLQTALNLTDEQADQLFT